MTLQGTFQSVSLPGSPLFLFWLPAAYYKGEKWHTILCC